MKRSDKQISMDDSIGQVTRDDFLTAKDDFDDVESNQQIKDSFLQYIF